MAQKVAKKRMWKFVFYPESAPNWKEIIEDWGLPVAVSPLQDKDVKDYETGELDKPHYHGLMEFDGPTPYNVAVELVEQLNVHTVKPCNSRRRDERYLCHLDSENKTKYDVADITLFGGYEMKFLGDRYELDTIGLIHDMAEELGIVYYADLANEIIEHHPDLVSTLLRYPAHFNNWCYSRERMKKYFDTHLVETTDENGNVITKLMSSYVCSRTKIGR